MTKLILRNLILTFLLSTAIAVIALYGAYRFYPSFGVYFDTSINELLEWVIMVNVILFVFSLPALLIGLDKIRSNVLISLLLYYYAPLTLLGFALYNGYQTSFNAEQSIPNISPPLIFLIIHAIFYNKIIEKRQIIT